MRRFALFLALVSFGGAATPEPAPLWAYGYATPPSPADLPPPPGLPWSRKLVPNENPAEQTRLRRVPGSEAEYSLLDIRDPGNVIDWFPDDHPPMPAMVRHGPAGRAEGCADCHLPTGQGRPENAPVAGQSVAYFLRQLEDFRSGARTSADPRKRNIPVMIAIAKLLSREEMEAAAGYYGAIPWASRTRVVETEFVPRTQIKGNLFVAIEKALTEPIAGRIIEVPENEEQSETLGNPRSGFIAYVPPGSLQRGEVLVTTGGAPTVKTIACATCHGPDLMGAANSPALVDTPGLAGRSPSYLVRQLFDLQHGARRGQFSPLMQPVVANLSVEDMTAIAAYLASLGPKASRRP